MARASFNPEAISCAPSWPLFPATVSLAFLIRDFSCWALTVDVVARRIRKEMNIFMG
jgi:hypothetical protein